MQSAWSVGKQEGQGIGRQPVEYMKITESPGDRDRMKLLIK